MVFALCGCLDWESMDAPAQHSGQHAKSRNDDTKDEEAAAKRRTSIDILYVYNFQIGAWW